MMVLAVLVATAIPLAFLLIVWKLDLYASSGFGTVAACFIYGLVAFFLALTLNNLALTVVSFMVLTTLVAPVLEELLKSVVLVYFVRRPEFTYFVDGAIFGFATGTAFSVFENYLYVSQNPRTGLALALARVFSTGLMHGTASALMGTALGRLRFGSVGRHAVSLVIGWLAAIVLHGSFNHVVNQPPFAGQTPLAIVIGLGGMAMIAGFITWGLREERVWIEEMLAADRTVSAGEARVVDRMTELDRLLRPVAARFGNEKAGQVRAFLALQAQLGLKQKARLKMSGQPRLEAQLEAQIAELRARIEQLRQAVGIYCMTFVRSIFPPESDLVWGRLEAAVARQADAPAGINLWAGLAEKTER